MSTKMVRNYKNKADRMTWNELSVAKAIIAANKREMGFSLASRFYGVPTTTLRRRVGVYHSYNDIEFAISRDLTRKFTPVFSPEQEAELVNYFKDLGARLHGLSAFEMRTLAYQLAEKNQLHHPFMNGIAGEDWLQGFLKRNKSLSLRKPEGTSAARATGFNEIVVQNFFKLLQDSINQHKLLPHRIFNVDETGCTSVPKTHGKIIAEKGKKQVGILTSAERGKNVTVEVCVSASGEYLPPLFIFPRKRIKSSLLNNTLPGSWGLCHPTGWMQSELFFEWFKWFVDQVKPTAEDAVLLILDGHTTHTNNLDVIDYARNHHIIIICLPPHCTHRLQPLDVSLMKPISSCYEKQIRNWLRSHPGRVVTPEVIPMLFSNAFQEAAKTETILSGFRKTGIYPLNPTIFNKIDFAPADVTNDSATIMSNDIETTLESEEPSDEQFLEKLSQSFSDLLLSNNAEVPIASTSTSTPSLRSHVGFFRPIINDSSSDEDDLHKVTRPSVVDCSSSLDNKGELETENKLAEISNVKRKTAVKFNVSPYDINPLPSVPGNDRPRKHVRGKTAVLTSLEYRQML